MQSHTTDPLKDSLYIEQIRSVLTDILDKCFYNSRS